MDHFPWIRAGRAPLALHRSPALADAGSRPPRYLYLDCVLPPIVWQHIISVPDDVWMSGLPAALCLFMAFRNSSFNFFVYIILWGYQLAEIYVFVDVGDLSLFHCYRIFLAIAAPASSVTSAGRRAAARRCTPGAPAGLGTSRSAPPERPRRRGLGARPN
ncbi:hypothetical protein EVAR_44849_1 [Eumeta japonica]|uniref:Uncharacterized protein n=1 Tax=Eumeta variegata TaxID=151549 RepID=A0A4C1YNU8_EUMVA|nr:hypothetical protein EVAR_44849_1 [Eumeta japonica]